MPWLDIFFFLFVLPSLYLLNFIGGVILKKYCWYVCMCRRWGRVEQLRSLWIHDFSINEYSSNFDITDNRSQTVVRHIFDFGQSGIWAAHWKKVSYDFHSALKVSLRVCANSRNSLSYFIGLNRNEFFCNATGLSQYDHVIIPHLIVSLC